MPGLAAAARRLSAGGQEDSDDDEDKYIAKVPSYVTYEWEDVPEKPVTKPTAAAVGKQAAPQLKISPSDAVNQREFLKACDQGNMVAVKLYVEHRTKFCLCSDNRGQSPIHVAVKSGNLAVAEYLHSMGSPIDGSDIMGSQPIHKACANKEKPEAALAIAQWLHSKGINLEAGGNAGWRPMHWACFNGNFGLAQFLHAQGASIDAKDHFREQPIHKAVSGGHLELAQWLHTNGASLTVPDQDGLKPLARAQAIGYTALAEWLKEVVPEEQQQPTASVNVPTAMVEEVADQVAADIEKFERAVDLGDVDSD